MPIPAIAVLRAVAAFLRRYWRGAAVLVILLVTWLHGHHTGDTARDREWSARWHQHVAEDATLAAKAEAAARHQEQQWAALYDAHTAQLIEENRNVAAHRDRLLSAARAGRLRLPTCPAGVPEAAAGSAPTESGAEGGQSAMVGELVNRLAVCDEVTLERNMAVELLRKGRE